MKSIRRNVLWGCLLFAPLVQGAPEDSPPAGSSQQEVVIEATRANLVKLGKDVQLSEYRFYQRYNQLNKNREYAIECVEHAPIGSHLRHTECQPVFKTKAEQEETRAFLDAYQNGADIPGHEGSRSSRVAMKQTPEVAGGSPSIQAAEVAIAGGRPGFVKNIIEVTNQSPELTKMAQEHAELWKRFYAMYRELNGAGPAPEEKPAAPKSP
jgi:hypothetical protein